ncbi:hypothetical protein BKA81DRAFT_416029 [Phyllosticta paracitricarpa]
MDEHSRRPGKHHLVHSSKQQQYITSLCNSHSLLHFPCFLVPPPTCCSFPPSARQNIGSFPLPDENSAWQARRGRHESGTSTKSAGMPDLSVYPCVHTLTLSCQKAQVPNLSARPPIDYIGKSSAEQTTHGSTTTPSLHPPTPSTLPSLACSLFLVLHAHRLASSSSTAPPPPPPPPPQATTQRAAPLSCPILSDPVRSTTSTTRHAWVAVRRAAAHSPAPWPTSAEKGVGVTVAAAAAAGVADGWAAKQASKQASAKLTDGRMGARAGAVARLVPSSALQC